jgi:uncharacterized membrane protein YhhN
VKKQYWIILFSIILAIHLSGILLKNQLTEYVSKPMIIVLLVFYFISETSKVETGLKKWIMTALLFSWLGDVVLLFQPRGSIFFLFGLSAFLLAHIFYIIFFHRIRVKENIRSNPWLLAIVVIYYVTLIIFLSPYLADMRLPVRIYGIVISFMFLLAMHMLFIKNKTTGRLMMIGALLFVISDSILAINKFYQSFELSGIVIMLTYGLAQLFIVEGAARYITSVDKE